MIKKIYRAWRDWVKHWHGEIIVMVELFKDPNIPRLSKFLIFTLLSYIFSPIDIIPDFIPIIGHWDDFAAIPFTLWLIGKITPPEMIQGVRDRVAADPDIALFKGWGPKLAAVTILVLWIWISALILKLMGFDSHF
ncbi:MAG: DUF1232 domain-containing protein [Candidatus Heimdallarchaeota archaeon]|nr:DUF1232 domain-containing protein [Candidatus Heimdallarchaeota archaeon]MDH5645617.1 DUF1232 domain-containing protein [Candidatus Heimdallarchaeota archaeon]